jgi:hypothetical protein
LYSSRKTERGAKLPNFLDVRAAPFALAQLYSSRKTERGAKLPNFLDVRAAPFALAQATRPKRPRRSWPRMNADKRELTHDLDRPADVPTEIPISSSSSPEQASLPIFVRRCSSAVHSNRA